ncbi:unnamed protein product [Cylindrotheca closterium]|uniref:HMG box domain-containing protein n=1 Tax=Cylindrotheca closterium TaxID=2856 RepID=A0AAD2FPR4_9STRA|nr:unnamed protein product [Cylindrotheca closterium]
MSETEEYRKFKDPNKLKRSFSTFLLYAMENLQPLQKETEFSEAKFGVIAKELSQRFRNLSDETLKGISHRVLEHPLEFSSIIEDFEFTEEPKRKKMKKDPNAPKRNMTPYFLFSISARPEMQKENPSANFGQIARLLSGKFNSLPAEEKEVWKAKADEDKVRYEKEMAVYRQTNPA